ncbi:hypothetical protein BB560_005144, partial [Smittium megazygosporum]
MDVDATILRHIGPLSYKEKERRKRLKLCHYCGKSGHYVSHCPILNESGKENPHGATQNFISYKAIVDLNLPTLKLKQRFSYSSDSENISESLSDSEYFSATEDNFENSVNSKNDYDKSISISTTENTSDKNEKYYCNIPIEYKDY